MNRSRAVLLWGLAVLWLLDGLLQLQPAMFTTALVQQIWAPVAQGNPGWLSGLVNGSIHLASRHLVPFNAGIALIQFAIAAALLSGRPRSVRIGIWGSLLFGLGVWVFGEGMGGVLTGGASLLTGAPGSTFVYAVASGLLLVPSSCWRSLTVRLGIDPLQAVTGGLFLVGAFWQLAAPFWTPFGLSAPVASNFNMSQPAPLRALIGAASGVGLAAPHITNLALIVALAVAAVGVILVPDHVGVFAGTLALLLLLWLVGQDAGMLFTGTATDPSSRTRGRWQ